MLYDKGYARETILALFRFIDWVIELPETKNTEFWQTLTAYEQEKKMPYITSVERIGIQKGIEQGMLKGESKLLTKLLTQRFGLLPAWSLQKIEQASSEELEQWGMTLLDADTLEDVFK